MSSPHQTQNPAEDRPAVLVVEDCPTTSQLVCEALENYSIPAISCGSIAETWDTLRDPDCRIGTMLIDIGLPDGNGIDLLREVRRIHQALPCFMLTASDTVDTAVLAMKAGARDYFTKPVPIENLVLGVSAAIATCQGGFSLAESTTPLSAQSRPWKSGSMREAIKAASDAARTRSTVLITGAPSTGKTSLARLIHNSGCYRDQPFMALNPASLPADQLLEDWFGISRFPLTNFPHHRSIGKLSRLKGVTVYIENVEALSLAAQEALLHWLETNQAEGTGKQAPCRVIASSTADLEKEVSGGQFRRDLWHALSVYQIRLPSLSERPEDLPIICENIITRLCVVRKLRRPSFTRKAMEAITDYHWPGNLSELGSALEHAVTHTLDGIIAPTNLPRLAATADNPARVGIPLGAASIDDITKASLLAALQACQGNRRRTAQRLKVSLRTVYNMIQRYQINDSNPKPRRGSR